MAKYVLEDKKEFDRLEAQSKLPQYDFREELKDLPHLPPNSQILDAGCGSGIVSRYLAERFSESKVCGLDASEMRVTQARQAEAPSSRLEFQSAKLTALPFQDCTFDLIICRFVLEHMGEADQKNALRELLRCLKSGGTLFAIDLDGLLLNIHPQTPLVAQSLKKLQQYSTVDFQMGRKIPKLLADAKFTDIKTRVQAMHFTNDALGGEIQNTLDRFNQARPLLLNILGTEAEIFEKEYVASLREKGSVLFYNKFIVQARKESPKTHLKAV